MIVLNTKTVEELQLESTSDLEAVGFSASEGSIARLFMNLVNKYIGAAYNTLSVNHLRAFVTTADGAALDAIGKLLQCVRLQKETDDNYRYRITNQCLTLATSNETAVRLTALTVSGVASVILKPYSMGAGSFSVIVVPESDTNVSSVIETVRAKLLDVHGYGIRYNVTTPVLTYVTIKHRVFLDSKLSDIERQAIKYDVQLALTKYLSQLNIGQSIITDQITQVIMNVSEHIIQEANVEFYINGQKALYVNQSCRWFERFMVSRETDSVIII